MRESPACHPGGGAVRLDWTRLVTGQNVHFWAALAFLAFVEVSAVFFNLLPIPGIDGFGALSPLRIPISPVSAGRGQLIP